MKKLSFLIALLISASSIFAQGSYPGIPLYGTAANSDRTYRGLQLGTTTITDTLGATPDTVLLIPGFVSGAGAVFHKDYIFNLKDSAVLAIANKSSSYEFSTMTIYISMSSVSGWVKFLGYSGLATQWNMTSGTTKISPTASHWYVINFVQVGTAWIETSSSQD